MGDTVTDLSLQNIDFSAPHSDDTKLRVLVVLSTFPPHYYGGAEISTYNISKWLASKGNEVGVITCADDDEPEQHGEMIDGLKVWRLHFPRPYTFWNHVKAPKWKKPLWYFQDHFDPRNRRLMHYVLESFKPDCVNVHVASGIGFNSLAEMARLNIPTTFFLHDLSLACMWGGMFANGKVCEQRCGKCKIVSDIRFGYLAQNKNLAFCSPSRANLDKAASVLPIYDHLATSIFNPNRYPAPTIERTESDRVRFLYVGRLSDTKGIDLLLDVLDDLSQHFRFTIDLLGEGAQGEFLRQRYADKPWCTFHGHVKLEEVSNFMARSDVLCIPSIWAEPLGGVVLHALGQGLPVLGSEIGGIPEMINHEKNGLLVKPGDRQAWTQAIKSVLDNPEILNVWAGFAMKDRGRFDQDANAQKIFELMKSVVAKKKNAERII